MHTAPSLLRHPEPVRSVLTQQQRGLFDERLLKLKRDLHRPPAERRKTRPTADPTERHADGLPITPPPRPAQPAENEPNVLHAADAQRSPSVSDEIATPEDLVIRQPTTRVFTTWGSQVRHPLMQNQWHSTPQNTKGTHAVLAEGAVSTSPLKPVRIENCWVQGGPKTRWGFRCFGPKDWILSHTKIFDIKDEHGCYFNSCWNITWQGVRFENIGSQGIQVVWRDAEAQHPDVCVDPYDDGKGSAQKVTGCVFLEVGQPTGGRPSYAASFFERQPSTARVPIDVIIERSWFESSKHANREAAGGPWYSYGAIMVHGRRRVVIDSNVVRYSKPNRAVIQVWDCDELVLTGCDVLEGLVDIRNVGKVRIHDNKGGALVQIADGPLYSAPSDRQLIIVHKGAISKNFSK